jgi:RNA-binding protein
LDKTAGTVDTRSNPSLHVYRFSFIGRCVTYASGKLIQEGIATMITLTGKQVRHLRGLGHHLNPVVMIGKGELTPAILTAVEEALDSHELIKLKLQEGCLLDRREVAEALTEATGGAIAQVLGKTILLYRPSENRKITFP